ncbi:MAG: hypothetical protein WCK27_13655, partial [Verrucomicrobiota bacterium]
MQPPINSTMRLEMARPRPVPPRRPAAPPSAWTNGWKRRAPSSALIYYTRVSVLLALWGTVGNS